MSLDQLNRKQIVILPSRKAIPGIVDTDITQDFVIHDGPTYSALGLELEGPLHAGCTNHVP